MLKFISSLCFLSVAIFAQTIDVWQNYTSKGHINKIDISESAIWAATEGGAFEVEFNSANSSFHELLQLTKSEGLSSQILSAVAISTDGKVWFGSNTGIINIYNSSNGEIQKILDINRSDNSKRSINNIQILDDVAYVSTEFGLSLIDIHSLQFIETISKFGEFPSGTSINSVTKIQTQLYVSAENGVAVQKQGTQNLSNPESWDVFFKGTQIEAGTIYRTVSYLGFPTIATDNGIFQLVNNVWERFLNISSPVREMEVSGESLFYISGNTLYQISGSTTQQLDNSASGSLTDIKISGDLILLASTNGLEIFQNGIVATFKSSGPTTNFFQNMDIDPSGNLWVGTGRDAFGAGFMKFDGTTWETYNLDSYPQFRSNAFHNVYAAPDNTVYALNWGSGFVRIKDNNFDVFYTDNTDLVGIPDDPQFLVIDDVGYDSKNNAWILNHWAGNQKVLSVLTPDENWYHFQASSPLSPQSFETDVFAVDNNDTKWFSVITGNTGLYYFNENGTLTNTEDDDWGRLSSSEYFGDQNITALEVDNRGELWVGTTLGVTIITNTLAPRSSRFSVFGLRQQSINCIAVDPINRKWVGTRQGVFVMTPDGSALLAQYDSKNSPLASDNISSITFDDKNGMAYIGTDFGLSSLTTDAVQAVIEFSEFLVYPNPFVIAEGNNKLTIDGLLQNSFIKILSINGDLVDEFPTSGGRIGFWDGRGLDGKLVPSGVYIIVAYDEEANNVNSGKVAVLRR